MGKSMNKSEYFSPNNIESESKLLLEKLKSIINYREKYTLSKNSALMVLDVQKYFTYKHSHAFVPSSIAIIQNINKIIKCFNSFDFPIIFTRHFNSDNDSNMMNKWWNKRLEKESENFDLDKSIILKNNSIVIEKEHYDAFHETNLDIILKDLKVDTLHVCGLMTHLCCEATIRSAFIRGYKTFFVFDATASYNQEFHLASFLNLSHGFTVPILTNNLISELKNE